MKKGLKLLVICVLCSFGSFAQTYESGYILTPQNDTVRGYILDKTDGETGLKISFKKQLTDSAPSTYSSSELHAFGFDDGRVFVQHVSKDQNQDTAKVFAKRILQGKIDLFVSRLPNSSKETFFLKNNETNEVVQVQKPVKEIITLDNGTQLANESKSYIGLVNYMTSDAPGAPLYAENERYSAKKISQKIAAYNDLFASDFATSSYKEKQIFSYALSAGVPIIGNSNGTDNITFFRLSGYRLKQFPEKDRKMSYLRGFSYRYASWLGDDGSTRDEHAISILPWGIHYQSERGLIRPYAYFGLGVLVLLKPFTSIDENANAADAQTKHAIVPLIGANIGAGVKIKSGGNFFHLELTPTGNGGGVFINIGYTF